MLISTSGILYEYLRWKGKSFIGETENETGLETARGSGVSLVKYYHH